ncbi:MAG TPA: hypothetical protein PKW35_13145, partial [Nannocystaceae bacterium]|nr:hypothetical protein [Nannocystaceae bacterium]
MTSAAETLLQAILPTWRAELPPALAGDAFEDYLRAHRDEVLARLDAWLREAAESETEAATADKPTHIPWWRLAPTIPRHHDTEALRTEAAAIFDAVHAYLTDPEWSILDEDERAEILHAAVVPHWELDDAARLAEAVADVDAGLRDEGNVLEEIAAALRDGTDPELEIHTTTPDAACEFVALHHRHLPLCNRRGIVHALAARWRGQIVAVALAGAPTGRWGRASTCTPEGTLEITRVASIAGLRRYDRRGRLVPVGAASALVARLLDLLPESGRGVPGCRLITYQLTSEDGAIYRALVAKGLRPVAGSRHHNAGGARRHVALLGDKIRWEAG